MSDNKLVKQALAEASTLLDADSWRQRTLAENAAVFPAAPEAESARRLVRCQRRPARLGRKDRRRRRPVQCHCSPDRTERTPQLRMRAGVWPVPGSVQRRALSNSHGPAEAVAAPGRSPAGTRRAAAAMVERSPGGKAGATVPNLAGNPVQRLLHPVPLPLPVKAPKA